MSDATLAIEKTKPDKAPRPIPSPFWREVVKAGAAGMIGGLVTLAVASFTFVKDNRELDIKMVTLGLSILNSSQDDSPVRPTPPNDDPSPVSGRFVFYGGGSDNARAARLYAVALLKRYSGEISIDEDFWEKWAAQGDVPGLDAWLAGSIVDDNGAILSRPTPSPYDKSLPPAVVVAPPVPNP